MSYSLTIHLDGLPSMNTAAHRHWAVQRKRDKAWATLVHYRCKGHRPRRPLPHAWLELVRRSTTEPDFDNLVHSFKPLLDQLVKSGIIEDDKPSCITPVYFWEKAERGAGSISIGVYEEAIP